MWIHALYTLSYSVIGSLIALHSTFRFSFSVDQPASTQHAQNPLPKNYMKPYQV